MTSRLFGALAVAVAILWVLSAAALAALVLGQGLRGQYFSNDEWRSPSTVSAVDWSVSTAQMFARWRASPPGRFSAQWSGYLHVPADGSYTFTIRADGAARLFIDGALMLDHRASSDTRDEVDFDALPVLASRSVTLPLAEGPHRALLQFARLGTGYGFEWTWARGDGPRRPVPSWALSPTPRAVGAAIARWADRVRRLAGAGGLLLLGVWAVRLWSATWPLGRRARWRLVARAIVLVALVSYYVAGATRHAELVNTTKSRGDQSGYLLDAQRVYANWRGLTPPTLIGERMRMPLYAAFLAWPYTPSLSNYQFFEVAKRWNIYLSLVLLGLVAAIVAAHLPPLVSLNLMLTIAFGYFVFKAGYSQPELLFYVLFFATFVACCHLLAGRGRVSDLVLGILAGTLAGLAYLTKAVIPPFLALFLGVFGAQEIVRLVRHRTQAGRLPADRTRRFWWRAAAGAATAGCFLAVVSPYILHSKREMGAYFFNANTSHYMWYDDGATARLLMRSDSQGRVLMPPELRPTLGSYLRTRSPAQILARLRDGFEDILVRSYETYWYWRYVLLYVAYALLLIAANGRAFARLVADHAALFVFFVGYLAIYLTGTAFFSATSGTGTSRFFLAHLAPFLFVLTCFVARRPFSDTTLRVGGVAVRAGVFHLAVLGSWGVDLAIFLWPRLMTTYGGF